MRLEVVTAFALGLVDARQVQAEGELNKREQHYWQREPVTHGRSKTPKYIRLGRTQPIDCAAECVCELHVLHARRSCQQQRRQRKRARNSGSKQAQARGVFVFCERKRNGGGAPVAAASSCIIRGVHACVCACVVRTCFNRLVLRWCVTTHQTHHAGSHDSHTKMVSALMRE